MVPVPRRRRGLVILGATAVVLAGAGAAWFAATRPPPVRYLTRPLATGDVVRTVSATGTVNPEVTTVVGSYVSGVVKSLSCDYNTRVRAGQVCARIDPRPFQATFDQYSAQLARDQAIAAKDRANLARYQTLLAQDSIARQLAEDQARQVQQDAATVRLDQALVRGAKLNLGYTSIVSPVSGTVVSRNVTQGQTVAASFQTPTLFLIATDLTRMQVDTNTSESDVTGLKVGARASFTVDGWPQRVFHGVVSQIRQSPQTVQNVVTYDVVITVGNRDLALMPGMTAAAQMVSAEREGVLRAPNAALRYAPKTAAAAAGGGPRVWVLRDGRPVAVAVRTGLADDAFTEISGGGLKAGDAVIVGEGAATGGGTRRTAAAPQPRL
ncbi:efflux RND transporter periplasmic adaptor subunit [Caulobacter sp. KR2-114]|uniref:efflux RND transporter periplasmic adaptor subunit n=1 Tax=Caulobacter sp. KR2-114 TaxID=3400912 RepID=UPI003C080E90